MNIKVLNFRDNKISDKETIELNLKDNHNSIGTEEVSELNIFIKISNLLI